MSDSERQHAAWERARYEEREKPVLLTEPELQRLGSLTVNDILAVPIQPYGAPAETINPLTAARKVLRGARKTFGDYVECLGNFEVDRFGRLVPTKHLPPTYDSDTPPQHSSPD